jgi:YegS/Rv2252/BmrU family lipid kinase
MNRERAAIIYNPKSGRSPRRSVALSSMVESLGHRGIGASVYETKGPGDGERLARQAVADGFNTVVSYGGDGTLNEVIQGLVGSDVALAVWAGGTANVAAHDLELPFQVEPLARVIAQRNIRRISVGLARTAAKEGNGRYFFMFAGIGLDASICRGIDPGLKRRTGQFAFWVSGVKHLFSWQPQPFVLEIDGSKFEATFAVIGKGKSYGGGFRLTPNARLEDPWFEVYIVPRLNSNIYYLWQLVNSVLLNQREGNVKLVTGRTIQANSAVEPWVEVDGELIGPLPVRFEVVPDALSVIVP